MDYTIIIPLCLVLVCGLCVNFIIYYINKSNNRLHGACHHSTQWAVEGNKSGNQQSNKRDVNKWINS